MSSAEHVPRARAGSSRVRVFVHLMLRTALGQILVEGEGTTQETESPLLDERSLLFGCVSYHFTRYPSPRSVYLGTQGPASDPGEKIHATGSLPFMALRLFGKSECVHALKIGL